MNKSEKRAKRTRLSPDARRSQLLDIGVDILITEPLEELTAERIAGTAGVSRGLVYHYFPSVRQLHLAVLGEAANELARQVAEAALVADGEERVRRGLDAFVAYLEQRPMTFLIMSNFAATDADFGEIFEGFRSQMVLLIRDQAGISDDPLIVLLIRSWVSFVESAVIQWAAEAPVDRQELIDMLVTVMTDIIDRWAHRR